MRDIKFSIDPEIFSIFPEYRRGVVVLCGVKNGSSPDGLIKTLRETEEFMREQLDLGTIAEEPRLAVWREAFRTIGIKPADYRPSVEALIRRVLHGQDLPTINALVDVGTIISLRYLVPIGGHAIDVIHHDIALKVAAGDEEFIPLGTDSVERPNKGEIIFVEGNTVLTRRWIWRQANHTITEPCTAAIEYNIDYFPLAGSVPPAAIGKAITDLVVEYCGGEAVYQELHRANPDITIACS
jgi:DNA/RNA-binding domain of Phe-tRNA-synthetase-like protein